MIKLDPGKLALQIICTSHIHSNILCRLRFIVVKSVAGVKHCPISPATAHHANIAVCSEQAFMSGRARLGILWHHNSARRNPTQK